MSMNLNGCLKIERFGCSRRFLLKKNKEHLKSKVWSAVCEPEAAAYQVSGRSR